ncbi:MAG: hypothetical protein R3Y50_05725 [Rikenellaceae bacterium]
MKKVTLLLAIAILTLTGCNSYEQSEKLSSVASKTLKGKAIEFKANITLPLELFCTEDGIFIYEETPSGFIKFAPYSLESISSFGDRGTDSKRFMTPKVEQLNSKELIITSFNSHNVTISGNSKGEVNSKDLDFKNKELFFNIKYISHIEGDKYITSEKSENQINIADDNAGNLECYTIFPFENKDSGLTKFDLVNTIFTSEMSYSNKNNTLFMAYTYYPYTTTIDMKDKKILKKVEIKVGKEKENEYTIRGANDVLFLDAVLFYTQCVTTKNYNWALYHGCRMGEMVSNKSEIHQFSKSGELLKRYILDRSIFNFGVTPNEENIYTINVNPSATYSFLKYDI